MGDSDNIPGIYNYCDCWCERCPFTARCASFTYEEEVFADPRSRHPKNAEFWEQLTTALQHSLQLVREAAQEMGLDIDDLESAGDAGPDARDDVLAEKLVTDATAYVRVVSQWLESATERLEEKETELASLTGVSGADPEADAVRIRDAIEVVEQYQDFIVAKLSRALGSAADELERPLEGCPSDADGSAKVALIAIDRSIAAWTVLREQLPEDEDAVLDILVQLARLRVQSEARFPRARSFVRPGFDEPVA